MDQSNEENWQPPQPNNGGWQPPAQGNNPGWQNPPPQHGQFSPQQQGYPQFANPNISNNVNIALGLSIAGIVTLLLTFCCGFTFIISIPLSIGGIIMGRININKIKANPLFANQLTKAQFAFWLGILGVVLGVIVVIFLVFFFALFFQELENLDLSEFEQELSEFEDSNTSVTSNFN